MEKKYVFLYGKTIDSMNLLSDLKNNKDIFLLKSNKIQGNNIFRKLLCKICTSQKISKIFKLQLGYNFFEISKFNFNEKFEYYMLVFAESFINYDYYVFKELNKRKNVHLSVIFLDSMRANTPMVEKQKQFASKVKWDYIFSFDLSDCKDYGYEYLDEMYYSKHNMIEENTNEYDLYYIGRIKPGRGKEIIEIYNKLKEKGLKMNFNLVSTNYKLEKFFTKEELNNGINYINYFKNYDEVLNEVTKSRCILEYNTTGQKSQSLRYFEAVTLNKKLLTNNPNINELKFYDNKYMKVFNNINDINIEWIKKDEKIDYNYKNEFSPIRLIDKIDKLYNKNEG